jgi:hypothetical protein
MIPSCVSKSEKWPGHQSGIWVRQAGISASTDSSRGAAVPILMALVLSYIASTFQMGWTCCQQVLRLSCVALRFRSAERLCCNCTPPLR